MVRSIAILASLLAATGLALIAFCIGSLRHRRYDVIDAFWGPLIATAAWTSLSQIATLTTIGTLALLMVSLWAVRLSWYIGRRWWHSPIEDPRYVLLRRNWPQRWLPLQIFARIYLLQACLATAVALPVIIIVNTNPAIGWWTYIGLTIWCGGLALEIIADYQLASFMKTGQRNRLLTTGLRRWIRHPNYLGEISLWWGLALIGAPSRYWWLSALGALTITWLIVKISGIPPAEQRLATKPGWRAYRQQTGALLPKLPI
jgi:steroid 5-alpha reductase family enzyme